MDNPDRSENKEKETKGIQGSSTTSEEKTTGDQNPEMYRHKAAGETSKPAYLSECCPIRNQEDLYTVLQSPPPWIHKIIKRENRSSTVVQNVISDCHDKEASHLIKPRLDARLVPRTLVCHDYKGGYLEDRYLEDVNVGNCYAFYNWAHIDIFIYFSHYYITIPPICWINAGHKNGVKVLGTFITEAKSGQLLCKEVFKDMTSMQILARNLATLTRLFKFDGWLLNIENPMEDTLILQEFVSYLTDCIHQVNAENLVIWYDSVLESGKLAWQNELNDLNKCYFDKCDGIFLNYVWTEETLIKSAATAKHRVLDVFAGIDVFGRNTFGGGHFDCYKAAEVIRRHNLSMAIFAPGWTHETLPKEHFLSPTEHFLNRDSAFWNSLWPYLYTHPVTKPFTTAFFKGVDAEWYNMMNQQIQLSRIPHPKHDQVVPNFYQIPTLGRKCNCLQTDVTEKNNALYLITKQNLLQDTYIHNLWHCDIDVHGEIHIYLLTKSKDQTGLDIHIIATKDNGRSQKIVLNASPKYNLIRNSSYIEVSPQLNSELYETLRDSHKTLLYEEGMSIRTYSFYLSPCKILEIGGVIREGDAVHLGAFGIVL